MPEPNDIFVNLQAMLPINQGCLAIMAFAKKIITSEFQIPYYHIL